MQNQNQINKLLTNKDQIEFSALQIPKMKKRSNFYHKKKKKKKLTRVKGEKAYVVNLESFSDTDGDEGLSAKSLYREGNIGRNVSNCSKWFEYPHSPFFHNT